MTVNELVKKYLSGGFLSRSEVSFLRPQLTRQMIENAAARDSAKGGQARKLFKLANILFATPHDKQPGKGSSKHITMFGLVREKDPAKNPHLVSGGGVNGTGKRG